jgi:hypothetical protein
MLLQGEKLELKITREKRLALLSNHTCITHAYTQTTHSRSPYPLQQVIKKVQEKLTFTQCIPSQPPQP